MITSFFFFNDTATTEIYTLSLHDALPICALRPTLVAGRCDMFIGLPHATERGPGATIALTRPFLEVGYAVVAPPTFILRSLDDLDGMSVGVLFASTPQTLLSVRDRVRLTTFRSTEAALDALAERQIDAAFLWG